MSDLENDKLNHSSVCADSTEEMFESWLPEV